MSEDKNLDSPNDTYPTVTQIATISDFSSALPGAGLSDEVLASTELGHHLTNLVDRTHEARGRVYVMDFGDGPWCVVAGPGVDITKASRSLRNVSRLQREIMPESLRNRCVYAHEFASAIGIAEGNMAAISTRGNQDASIYSFWGIHEIGYIPNVGGDNTMYFDLTSRVYVFTDEHLADNAVMQGLAVIEQGHQTHLIEPLYQTSWHREPFDRNPEKIKRAIEEWRLALNDPSALLRIQSHEQSNVAEEADSGSRAKTLLHWLWRF